nr:hypothetical protein Iba_chr14eCG9570 [Ipomoea batatas]
MHDCLVKDEMKPQKEMHWTIKKPGIQDRTAQKPFNFHLVSQGTIAYCKPEIRLGEAFEPLGSRKNVLVDVAPIYPKLPFSIYEVYQQNYRFPFCLLNSLEERRGFCAELSRGFHFGLEILDPSGHSPRKLLIAALVCHWAKLAKRTRAGDPRNGLVARCSPLSEEAAVINPSSPPAKPRFAEISKILILLVRCPCKCGDQEAPEKKNNIVAHIKHNKLRNFTKAIEVQGKSPPKMGCVKGQELATYPNFARGKQEHGLVSHFLDKFNFTTLLAGEVEVIIFTANTIPFAAT